MTAGTRRCAVIYNPTKVSEGFRAGAEERLRRGGWQPDWFETTVDDPGRAMVAGAVADRVDRVVAAGGDGTVRVVADGLAGSGIPLGIVPVGTGNLLARNLQLPLEEAGALDVACGGRTRAIDLVRLTADGARPEHFAVMAGTGLDAMIMEEVDPRLKDAVGAVAYVVAAAKALDRLPIPLTVAVDGRRARRRRAMLCVVGNVGRLQGGLTLIPGAEPDDGLLHVYVASPRRLRHWWRVALRLLTRRPWPDDGVDQWRGRRVEVVLSTPEDYELDGDVIGTCTRLVAEVRPGALVVCVP